MMRNISITANNSKGKIRVSNMPISYSHSVYLCDSSIFFSPSTLWQGQFLPFQINTKAENGSQICRLKFQSPKQALLCQGRNVKPKIKRPPEPCGQGPGNLRGRERCDVFCTESWRMWIWPRQAVDTDFIKSAF